MLDVTDATFERDVLERSDEVAVVVDLWAPWCGPCRTLGPILESVVEEAGEGVELVKVNVDDNPRVAASFQVQGIPAVYAIRNREVVGGFVGAQPRAEVEAFVAKLVPALSEADALVAAADASGDAALYRQALEIEPGNTGAVVGLARHILGGVRPAAGASADGAAAGAGHAEAADEVLKLLARVPETAETRQLAAEARLLRDGVGVGAGAAGVDALLDGLLERVKEDESARQEFVDLLETLGPDDPRTARYRKALAARLY